MTTSMPSSDPFSSNARSDGSTTIVRHAPNARRLRLAVPGLFRNQPRARRIEARLRQASGVEEVAADPNSGRVLIRYASDFRAGAADAAELPAQLARLLDHIDATEGDRQPVAPPAVPLVTGPALALPGRGEGDAQDSRRQDQAWHALGTQDVLRCLGSNDRGLDLAEVARRLASHGPNLIEPLAERSRLQILAAQF